MNTLEIYIERGRKEGIEKGRKEGIEEGIERGIQQGIERGKEEIVWNLLRSGQFSISEISEFTGVSETFIKKVRSSEEEMK